jgi:uncharacterized protein
VPRRFGPPEVVNSYCRLGDPPASLLLTMGEYGVGNITPIEERVMATQSTNQPGGAGNFPKDREKSNEPGRKGGQQSDQSSHGSADQSKNRSQEGGHGGAGGQQRGSGSFANDPDKKSEAGRKSGESSQGGKR